jgi:hypothetical protein
VFPYSSPPVPPTVHIVVVALDKHTAGDETLLGLLEDWMEHCSVAGHILVYYRTASYQSGPV